MSINFFTLSATDKKARAGELHTSHGVIKTPVFMPVGTKGTVKAIDQDSLKEIGFEIILGNTYHLYLRPGHELIETGFSSLHEFMSWDRAILTDSGGYQVFSLSDISKKSEEGVVFQSHLDGSYHLITPEKSMQIQRSLGSDIVMCFDECPALPSTDEILKTSMELTLRWAKRCKSVELKEHQKLFGIVQGGLNLKLRIECLERLKELDFPGYAVGGLSVGEKNLEMIELCKEFVHLMPQDRPRYLMGVGTPLDILTGIKNGLDMFDCVLPTRNARNGQFLTRHGPLNIKKERFKLDKLPPDPTCMCKVCQKYSRGYIRHLYHSEEILSAMLVTYHNLYFYKQMVNEIRNAIIEQKFDDYYKEFYNLYTSNSWN